MRQQYVQSPSSMMCYMKMEDIYIYNILLIWKYVFWQALIFYNCKNLVVKNLKIQNAQKMHVSFEKCVGVEVSGLTITAPADSPNTDGIHVTRTQNIQISSSVIGTGTLKTYPKTKLKIFSFLKK